MNRKSRIILSIVCIFSIIITLSVITYGYYVTKILNNPEDNSFDVITSKIEATYTDNNQVIELTGIKPSYDYLLEKDFVISNTGQEKAEYAVILDNITNTFENKKDIVYKLKCSSNINNTCNEVAEETTFPSINNLLVNNSLEVNEVHTYKLYIKYKESGRDQSNDLNKTIVARINITDANEFNPFDNKNSLAYKIVENAKTSNDSEKTKFILEKMTKPTVSKSYDKELRITADDYGESYFFRGSVSDNYVNFAGMCWKIVRIQGDGSIKLILEDKDYTCDHTNYSGISSLGAVVYGHKIGTSNGATYRFANYLYVGSGNRLKPTLENWFNQNVNLQNQKDLIKEEKWCFAKPNLTTLECSNIDEYAVSQVGTLTSLEALYAGGSKTSSNSSIYLCNNVNILLLTVANEWFDGSDYVYALSDTGQVKYNGGSVTHSYSNAQARPVITLISGVEATGMGTKDNPYIVE